MRINTVSDRATWEHFRETHAPGALFQSWNWGEVVRRQSIPLARFGLYDGSRLTGIFQVVTVRARRGTYLHVRHGPIFAHADIALWEQIVAFLVVRAKQERAWFIRVSPPLVDSDEHKKLLHSLGMTPSAAHEVDAERCWILNVLPDEESILTAMRKTTRYEIRRAIKDGVVVEQTQDQKRLSEFFALYKQTAARHSFVPHQGIGEEFAEFVKEDQAILFLGSIQDRLTAAAIILFVGDQAIYHHGASVPGGSGISYLVQWEAIREAKHRGMRWYNFWGISPEGALNHPWHGITAFKKGFGGQESLTVHAHDLPVSPLYWVTRAVEWWEVLKRGY